MVAGERAGCAVRAMHARRESHNQKMRIGIAKWRDRAAIIVRVFFSDLIEKCGQARALPAVAIEHGIVGNGCYSLVEFMKGFEVRHG